MKLRWQYLRVFTIGLLGIAALPALAAAGTFTAFGLQSYTRDTGNPVAVIESFSVLNPNTDYTIRINNGGLEDGEFEPVSSSIFILNGVQIVGPNEFNQNVTLIEKPVTLSTTNELTVEVRGKPGGGLTVEIIGVDNNPPTITASVSPQPNAAGWQNQDVTVSFDCSDATSGIATCTSPFVVQTEGAGQIITGTAVDLAGNTATASVTLNIDTTAPALSSTTTPAPNANGWNNADPTVSFAATDPLSGVASVSPPVTITTEGAGQLVTGTATDQAGNSASLDVMINLDKTAPTITGSVTPLPNAAGWHNQNPTVSFDCSDLLSGVENCTDPIVVLTEGVNQATLGTAVDLAGNTASTSVTLNIDKTPPAIGLVFPAASFATNQPALTVAGTVTDANPIIDVTLNGAPITLDNEAFSVDLALAEGDNLLTVTATDIADNTATLTRTVTLDTIPPQVAITTPANLSTFNQPDITVTGTVDDPQATITVNGVDAALSNGTFTADLTLGEGTRFITAVASDLLGNTATANISVTIDTTPPRVIINTPADGSTVFSSLITVTGMINDIVSGTVNGNNATVAVNGVPATVLNRGFMAEGISLTPGANTITAVGVDAAGNQAQTTATVMLDTTAQPTITALSGNNQTGPINTMLAQLLVIQLTDAAGNPVANQTVTFTITRNNGSVTTGQRTVTVTSNALGQAQASLTLGSYAGAGENRVEVSSPGFAGPALFTATGTAGSADMIHQVSDSAFRGAVNTALPTPLEVIVSDDGGNPVQGVPVTFTVVAGNGQVDNDTTTTAISTSDGKAHVVWVLGPDESIANNRVEATFENQTGLPVTFVASGVISGDPAQTSFSGIVLTNTEQPIPGVTVTIEGTTLTTQTNNQGHFTLTGVPVGAIHLIADANTATLPGFPYQMMYEVNTIAGRDNTIGMPIYLLPLDLPNAQPMTPTEGGTVSVSNVAGFSLDLEPGSVTFPDGTQTGSISVTQVHRDKVPMPPPNGLNPKIVFTIQPAGALFDPPAPIVYPNVDGRAPGEIVNLYSFDHDLGQWVSIGTGSVVEDGAFIVSDPGVGIIEGGWHFPEPPAKEDTDITNDDDQDENTNSFEEITSNFLERARCRNDELVNLALNIQAKMNKGEGDVIDERPLGVDILGRYHTRGLSPTSEDGQTFLAPRITQKTELVVENTIVHEARHAWQDDIRGPSEIEVGIDFNGDGIVDSRHFQFDKDGDGLPSQVPEGAEFTRFTNFIDSDDTAQDLGEWRTKREADADGFANIHITVDIPSECQ